VEALAVSPGSWPGSSRPPRLFLLRAPELGVAGTSPATTRYVIRSQLHASTSLPATCVSAPLRTSPEPLILASTPLLRTYANEIQCLPDVGVVAGDRHCCDDSWDGRGRTAIRPHRVDAAANEFDRRQPVRQARQIRLCSDGRYREPDRAGRGRF